MTPVSQLSSCHPPSYELPTPLNRFDRKKRSETADREALLETLRAEIVSLLSPDLLYPQQLAQFLACTKCFKIFVKCMNKYMGSVFVFIL